MDISLEFDHLYHIERMRETSGSSSSIKKLFFPGASETGGADGVLLLVTPVRTDAWIGSFAPGHRGHNFLNRIMSCPNPNEVCVISSGAGYIVRADNPSEWQSTRSIPVCDARAILDRRLLVLSDFTKLVAYGADGLKWESSRVSSDGIQITDITDGHLGLVGWDAAQQKKVRVSVNLDDGSVLSRSVGY